MLFLTVSVLDIKRHANGYWLKPKGYGDMIKVKGLC